MYTTAVTTYITPLITPEKVRCVQSCSRESSRQLSARNKLPYRESRRASQAYEYRECRASVSEGVYVCMCRASVGSHTYAPDSTNRVQVRMYVCVYECSMRRCKYARVYEYVCVCVCALAGGMCVGGA